VHLDGDVITSTYTLTSVSVQQTGVSDKVELQLSGVNYDRDVQKITVFVNGKAVVFDDHSLAWRDFKGEHILS